jgi:acyl carrier protein
LVLDAVEIILAWEMAFDIELEYEVGERLSTDQMAIDLISAKVGAIA